MAKKKSIQTSELVADCNQISQISVIEKRIFRIRDEQVMIDIDLANIYGIENRSLRQAVRRNID